MQWGEKGDAQLFACVLKIHDVKVNYGAVAAAMKLDFDEEVTAKAITHRIAHIKNSTVSGSQSRVRNNRKSTTAAKPAAATTSNSAKKRKAVASAEEVDDDSEAGVVVKKAKTKVENKGVRGKALKEEFEKVEEFEDNEEENEEEEEVEVV